MSAEFSRAARIAVTAFDGLSDISDRAPLEGGIGHNNPPPEARLVKEDYVVLAEQLRTAAGIQTAEASLRAFIKLVQCHANRIGEAIESRIRMVREGFYKQLGAMGAIVITGLITWLTFYGNLQGLEVAARAIYTHLFGLQ